MSLQSVGLQSLALHGRNFVGPELSAANAATFHGYNPREGSATADIFHEANADEVRRAAIAAQACLPALQGMQAGQIATFLESIADEIVRVGERLIEKADEETALGKDRLRGERDRTVNQLKLFAGVVREGSWVDARIDTPQPERKPVPKPDVRRMLRPLGPVAVFGASNFPLAFSVAGGDTASALAAGNPVIVKAHPAHPGTSELVATAVVAAARKNGFPAGTFSMLHGQRPEISVALVTDPAVKAVSFTGSLRAGRALYDAAARRPEPIPVFSEMGSVNPVFLLPGALEGRAEAVAEGFYRSVTLGVGQFCTSPGLAFGVESTGLDRFVGRLIDEVHAGVPGTMLNPYIAKGFNEAFAKASRLGGVRAELSVRESDARKTEGRPGVLVVDGHTWMGHPELREEMFGPSTVVVRCDSATSALACAEALEGALTATMHGTPQDLEANRELITVLERKAGRLIFNGFPTGVEVGYAMQHGGPYPASTDPRFTSVGTAAIYRFARPVCLQNFPDAALPPELQNANPRGIWRNVDGRMTKDSVGSGGAL